LRLGHGPEIIDDHKFHDFNLPIEFKGTSGSNPGIYCAAATKPRSKTTPRKSRVTIPAVMASLPHLEMPRRAGEWQSSDITLVGGTITGVRNGRTIVARQEIPASQVAHWTVTKSFLDPPYLQGSEDGHVASQHRDHPCQRLEAAQNF
jgi:hypothetical protein